MIMAIIFFFGSKKPHTLAGYIGFGFVWFSVIFYACLSYLISYNNPAIRELINIGYTVYFFAVFICSIFFADTLGLYNLILIDFIFVSAILIYVILIRYMWRNKKK